MESLGIMLALLFPLPDTNAPIDFGHRRDFYCAALAVFAESRGESPLGQLHVAAVIRNRVNRDTVPRSACDVIEEPGQFVGIEQWPLPRRPWDIDPVNWARAQTAVEVVFSGRFEDECTSSYFFFSRPGGSVVIPPRFHSNPVHYWKSRLPNVGELICVATV